MAGDFICYTERVISYELAKALKDAGFPQMGKGEWIEDPRPIPPEYLEDYPDRATDGDKMCAPRAAAGTSRGALLSVSRSALAVDLTVIPGGSRGGSSALQAG
jgi:hypothetical protein